MSQSQTQIAQVQQSLLVFIKKKKKTPPALYFPVPTAIFHKIQQDNFTQVFLAF